MVAKINGVDISYEVWGKGKPLICLHGGMGVDSSYLKVPAILQLASSCRQILIYDQRGHGRSATADIKSYSHSSWVNDLRELARFQAPGKFALLGHSYGGFLALEYALKYPSSLTHLILVGTSAGPIDIGQPPHPQNDDELRAFFKLQWPAFFLGADKFWHIFDEMTFSCAPYNAAFHSELKRYNVRDKVRRLQIPTLLLVGSEDHYVQDMRWLDQELPCSDLEVVAESGHFLFMEKPDEFRTCVGNFLSSDTIPRCVPDADFSN